MDLTGIVPESWAGIVTGIIALCAALATILPVPAESGTSIWAAAYRLAYRIIQWIGLNLGKAKNAQDKFTDKLVDNSTGRS